MDDDDERSAIRDAWLALPVAEDVNRLDEPITNMVD